MRIWSLAFVFGIGCSGGARGARVVDAAAPTVSGPVAVASAKLCGGGGPALNLAAIEPSYDLRLDVDRRGGVEPEDWKGKMTVDGVVTASMWPLRAPSVHRLADGRSLLNDTYNANLLMVWDPKTRMLTELARGVLFPVRGHGMLVYTGDASTGVYSDVDPGAPRLRELYRFKRIEQNTQPAGVIDGMPALLVQPATGVVADDETTPITMLCLSAEGVRGRFAAVVPAGFSPMSVDPIDGHRLLLVGRDRGIELLGQASWGKPFSAEVAVLDLVTGEHHSIGYAEGGWTQTTAIPHPVLSVGWNNGTYDRRGVWFAEDSVTLVDPKTEMLSSAHLP